MNNIKIIGKSKYELYDLKTHYPNIKKAIDHICSQIPEIQKQKQLGEGAEGVVYKYCIINDCNYVAKIQKITYPNQLIISHQEMKTTNKIADLGMAPRIYAIVKCKNIMITLMDMVIGTDLYTLLINNKLTKNIIDNLINAIKKIHKLNIYHGDLNPPNIFYNGKEFDFIDFTERKNGYKPYYDYATLISYLYRYINNKNYNIIVYTFKKLLKQMNKKDPKIKLIINEYNNFFKTHKINFENFKNILEIIGNIIAKEIFYPYIY